MPSRSIHQKDLTTLSLQQRATANRAKWSNVENDAGRVLAQIDTDPADNRFPLAIYRPFSGTRCLRFDPLHDNFRRNRSKPGRIRPICIG